MSKIYCACCARQIVNYKINNQYCIGGQLYVKLFKNEGICYECAKELDENGLFPEERNPYKGGK